MKRSVTIGLAAVLAAAACNDQQEPNPAPPAAGSDLASASSTVGINVVLKGRATRAQLAELGKYGAVKKQFPQINGLTLAGKAANLSAIRSLKFVKGAAVDKFINIPHTDPIPSEDLTSGWSTWDQDAINVTVSPHSSARDVSQTGRGVFVGILDTGLLNTWRQYFPQERVATQYATSFVGGGAADRGNVQQPGGDQWQHDVCAHGTHVASTILGYRRDANRTFQGTAPQATIIPVMLHSQGSANTPNSCGFFSSVAAAGLIYFGDLKAQLGGAPLVVNNSWGGSQDPLTTAAVNYALSKGVLLVFSAGNAGEAGMGYPGALPQVISAAASGWTKEWTTATWWWELDVPEPTSASDFYIADFSSREHAGQDLDVAAPGTWVVGPFQLQRGQPSFFFLGGTSMAAPHVTGTVALMLQKDPSLTQSQAETILQNTAINIGAGCRDVVNAFTGAVEEVCWGADATGEGLLNAEAAVAATP